MSQNMQKHTRMLYGRPVSAYSSVYLLPMDVAEDERLRRTNIFLKQLMPEFYQKIDEYLQARKGSETRCLDLGCGTGQWLFETASRYPDVLFAGIDLVPILSVAYMNKLPPNMYYTMQDMNLGLSAYYNQYDYVQAHFLAAGIRSYTNLVNDMFNILRPGGLMTIVELDLECWKSPGVRHSAPTAVSTYFKSVEKACILNGADTTAPKHLPLVLERQGHFVDVCPTDHWVCVVPPPGSTNAAEIASSRGILPMFNSMISSFQPVLSTSLSSERMSEIEDAARNELMSMSTPTYIRVTTISARKP